MAESYLIQFRGNIIKPMSDVFFNKVNFYQVIRSEGHFSTKFYFYKSNLW